MNSLVFQGTESEWRTAKRLLHVLAATIVVLQLVCLPLLSQSSQGAIQGAVFDQSGGAVSSAAVSVVDVARGVVVLVRGALGAGDRHNRPYIREFQNRRRTVLCTDAGRSPLGPRLAEDSCRQIYLPRSIPAERSKVRPAHTIAVRHD